MPPPYQSTPPKVIQPRDTNVARLLSALAEYYPGTRPMLAELHAMPEQIPVQLSPDKGGPTNYMGFFKPSTNTVNVSRYLDEPGAKGVMMHEMSHAHSRNFGSPVRFGGSENAQKAYPNAEFLSKWFLQNNPGYASIGGGLEEALADYRASETLGPTIPVGNLKQKFTPQQQTWAPTQPLWPILQNNKLVDDAYMRKVLGDKVFESIRAGDKDILPR
jgi:hypothetical protein